MTRTLTAPIASRFASLALSHLTREYPNKLTHSLAGPADVQGPRALHPVFYGSYDWHSCVHGYWLIARLLARFPDLPEAPHIVEVIDEHFTDEKMAGERAYLDLPHNRSFERPYGWAWLLALASQLDAMKTPQTTRWARTLAPLTLAFVERFEAFLPKATYPIRVGTHFNTAFALTLALAFARQTARDGLARLIEQTARRWYQNDAGCQAWEPSGDEFLSPALMEAVLMSHVLPAAEFASWFAAFLPDLAARQPGTLFTPATVTDRTDGKIAHLDGLNLSRAWCQRTLARTLSPDDARAAVLREAAQTHLQSALEHVAEDYMGEHWLASFATLALEA
ncbi:MAG: DUF2891 domain-containing protein [Paraburkholderia sp.]|uniref:DUF2891 domain-containing protein n=1 Tax=Paraburkholderia sp. TaxID=1926495 RepID=UPI001206AD58|nr:DUF2891 domain-containing protein [Paraburkholderia sp.]TAM05765.1 MAG: DUF2891 domain-containing protein [Paraburkholderia sp.]TAM28296.1 MAG: DUF2891 domain-containing protein [Paraburkholderia sp.]